MQKFNFIEKLAERVSKRTGKKVYPEDIKTYLFEVFMLVVLVIMLVVLWHFCSGISEKNTEIAAAFVKHFSTLK